MATKTATKKAVKASPKKEVSKKDSFKSKDFAVIETGGKQYKVAEGQIITIEKLDGEFKTGGKVIFDKVLMKDDGKNTTLGDPTIKGAKVEAKLVEAGRGKKITVIHYKSKSRYFRKNGHRQPFTKVEITKI